MTQDEFDRVIRDYNEDFHFLLTRAGRKNYEDLLSSFKRLKRLYDAIVRLQDSGNFRFRILPYPLSFRANHDLLRSMGFDHHQIKNIFGFLEFIKETEGKELEEILSESK